MSEMNEPKEFKINSRECQCGSGYYKYALKDAAGIFCCYVCGSCEENVKRTYNPVIFDYDSKYSTTGEEGDI